MGFTGAHVLYTIDAFILALYLLFLGCALLKYTCKLLFFRLLEPFPNLHIMFISSMKKSFSLFFSFTFHNLSSPRIIASEFFFFCGSPSTPMNYYRPFFRFIFLFQIYPPSKTDLHYSPFKDFTWSSVFNFALLATASLCVSCILIPWQHNQ